MALIFEVLTPVPEKANLCIFTAFTVIFALLLTATLTASRSAFQARYMTAYVVSQSTP